MIDMTSSNGKKNEAAKFEPMAPAMSRMASTIANMIAQQSVCFGSILSQTNPPLLCHISLVKICPKLGSF